MTRKAVSAVSAVSPEMLFDLVQRLGVVDLFADKIRAKLESTDIDELLDELGSYLRRNPELIVVGLGTITVMAGVAVFLDRRDDRSTAWNERSEPRRESRPRPATRGPQRRKAS